MALLEKGEYTITYLICVAVVQREILQMKKGKMEVSGYSVGKPYVNAEMFKSKLWSYALMVALTSLLKIYVFIGLKF